MYQCPIESWLTRIDVGSDGRFRNLPLVGEGLWPRATATAVTAFGDAPPEDRAMVGILAYRRWALVQCSECSLIFSGQHAAVPDSR